MNFQINVIEHSLRTVGVTLALSLITLALMRRGWHHRSEMASVLASIAAYLICGGPARPCGLSWLGTPLLLLAIAFPFVVWRLARRVLDDTQDVPWPAWLGLSLLLPLGWFSALGYDSSGASQPFLIGAAHKVVALGFLATMVLQTWRLRDGDLLASRRRLRTLLLIGIGAYSGTVMVIEIVLASSPPPVWLSILNVVLIDVLLMSIGGFLLGVRDSADLLLFAPREVKGNSSADPIQNTDLGVRPPKHDEESNINSLRNLMNEQHLWMDPSLTPARLALKLDVPEYVLRKLINERLGHRNFASFVNNYRFEAVATWLRDPALKRRPILTLALEAGFGSIGPFNRGFRERFGVSPSEYRLTLNNSAEENDLLG